MKKQLTNPDDFLSVARRDLKKAIKQNNLQQIKKIKAAMLLVKILK